MGCIKALTGVLSMANPVAFSRSIRIRRYVHQLVVELKLNHHWKYQLAALLSQLGCVTLTPEIIARAQQGEELLELQRAAFDKHPNTTRELIERIPRFEDVGWMVAQRRHPYRIFETEAAEHLKIGAEILRVAIAFDDLKSRGVGVGDADAWSARQILYQFE